MSIRAQILKMFAKSQFLDFNVFQAHGDPWGPWGPLDIPYVRMSSAVPLDRNADNHHHSPWGTTGSGWFRADTGSKFKLNRDITSNRFAIIFLNQMF